MRRRLLSLAMALAMALSLLPTAALAVQDETEYGNEENIPVSEPMNDGNQGDVNAVHVAEVGDAQYESLAVWRYGYATWQHFASRKGNDNDYADIELKWVYHYPWRSTYK